MKDTLRIRNSTDTDIPEITRIYAHEVLTGLASFEIQPPDETEMAARRRRLLDAGYPYLVAAINGVVVGYCYAGPYRSRPAYKHTLENSVYVASTARRCGIGNALLTELIKRCSGGGWHSIVAVIGDTDNISSVSLHLNCGFQKVGTLNAVGYKHNRWVNSVLMQLML